jgi:uncharacterized membrane protein
MDSQKHERDPKESYDERTKEVIADMRAHADELRAWHNRRDWSAFRKLIVAGWREGDRAAERIGWKGYVLPPLLSVLLVGSYVFGGKLVAWAVAIIALLVWLVTRAPRMRDLGKARRQMKRELDNILTYRTEFGEEHQHRDDAEQPPKET